MRYNTTLRTIQEVSEPNSILEDTSILKWNIKNPFANDTSNFDEDMEQFILKDKDDDQIVFYGNNHTSKCSITKQC